MKSRKCARQSSLRRTSSLAAFAPHTANPFFATSIAIVLTSLCGLSSLVPDETYASSLAHGEAVSKAGGGRYHHSTASCATRALTSRCSAASGKRARSSRRGGTTPTTQARMPVSAPWHRREFAARNQGSSALARTAWPAERAGAGQRAPAANPKTRQFFGRPQRVKGGRKNWDEDETKATDDTPQKGPNNRRTLLITGGKLGEHVWEHVWTQSTRKVVAMMI